MSILELVITACAHRVGSTGSIETERVALDQVAGRESRHSRSVTRPPREWATKLTRPLGSASASWIAFLDRALDIVRCSNA